MRIDNIKVGYLECNCYILEKDNSVLVIDPGDEYNKIKEAIGDNIKLLSRYNKELVLIKNDAELRRKYDELKEHFPSNFIKNYVPGAILDIYCAK